VPIAKTAGDSVAPRLTDLPAGQTVPLAKAAADGVGLRLADRPTEQTAGAEGDRVAVGLADTAFVQKGPKPREGIAITLVEKGTVKVLTDAVAPGPPGKLIRISSVWA
jgi:hypothetical protein